MNENFQKKYIFYGVVLFFLTSLLKDIIHSITELIICYLNFNIQLIPFISIIFCAVIIIVIFKIKAFPKLNLWLLLLPIIISLLTNLFLSKIYTECIKQYTSLEVGMNYSYIKGINYIFTLTFSIVAYIKYKKIKEK